METDQGLVQSYVVLFSMIFLLGVLAGFRIKKDWVRDKDMKAMRKRLGVKDE